MISLFFFLSKSENSISHLNSIVGAMNASVTSKMSITSLYSTSPLFLNLPRFEPITLNIFSMNFINFSQSILRGRLPETSISKCTFKNVIQPIHLDAISYGKLKPQSTRMQTRKSPLKLRDLLFDFCVSFNLDGGAIYAVDSEGIELTGVEFLQCRAKHGGGLFAKMCNKIKITETSFFRCEVEKNCGGMYSEECDIEVRHSFWVMNRANMYGALYATSGHITIIEAAFFENVATRSYAGATFKDCDGQIQSCRFVDNNAPFNTGGIALYIPDTADVFAIEFSIFNGDTPSFFTYGANTQVSIQENCFDVTQDVAISQVGDFDPTIDKSPFYGNNLYYGQCNAAPPLPARYYQELFHHPVVAKPIEWWKLYTGLGIFLVMIAMMAVAVPAVFFPLVSKDATRIGDHRFET